MTDPVIDVGDGLVLRQATADDEDALVEFNSCVHSDHGWDTPDPRAAAWVRDLMARPHPTFQVGDFLVVEDTATGEVVSSSCLIPQTWSYAGVTFDVGRPELVGTHPDYRRRGLVRAQMEVLHRWSAERGHQVQAITGIPNYYRQFGYEMALDLHGTRRGPLSNVPALKDGEAEPYGVRPATPDDLDIILAVDAHGRERVLVSCVRDRALWRYELEGKSTKNAQARKICIVEAQDGEPVGFLLHPHCLWYDALYLQRYELKAGVSWWAVTPSVLRYMQSQGAGYVPYMVADKKQAFTSLALSLGREHPAYTVVADWMPKMQAPYAWYLRVPDLPAFLRTIAPVLEKRLAKSVMVGHTGELRLNFYREGVKVAFEAGRIVEVAAWKFPGQAGSSAKFPGRTFLHLLFGHRSFAELGETFADCGAPLEQRLLVEALFPKAVSYVRPVS